VDVGELAVERRRRSRAQEIGGHHPRHVVDVAEARGNGRERGRNHHLVERREQHGEEHADDDATGGGMIEIVQLRVKR
jgi:hypothetical protein